MEPSKYGQDLNKLLNNEYQQKLDAQESVSLPFSGPAASIPLSQDAVQAVLKPDGQLLNASKAFYEKFGLKLKEKGENFFDHLTATDRSLLSRKFLLARHHHKEYEAQLRLSHGRNKQLVHLNISIQQDLVVLREIKPQIKKSLVKPSSFLEKIPFAALIYNSKYELEQVNKRFLDFAGYANEGALQSNAEELLFPKQSSVLSELWKSLERPGREKKESTAFLRLQTKEGAQRWVQLNIGFLADGWEEGFSPAYFALVQDVNELKEQEKHLLKEQEEMDIFMDRAFHDLKGPINSLLALYKLLEHEFGQDERVMEYVKHYHQGISRLHRVLHDLLILSRIKKAEPHLKPISLSNMVEDCLHSFNNLPHFYQIRFIKDIQVQGELLIEESLLQTIVQNLLENAIKYCSEEDPEVKIAAFLEQGSLNLQVSDNGIGIPEDLQQRVFERFFRATNKASGSGLGLYLLQQALQKLNGSVSLKSREGHGTTFSVLIPVMQFSQNRP